MDIYTTRVFCHQRKQLKIALIWTFGQRVKQRKLDKQLIPLLNYTNDRPRTLTFLIDFENFVQSVILRLSRQK